MKITRAISDPKVFARFFKGETWHAWRVFLTALFALPLTSEQIEVYRKHTGRSAPPTEPLHEAWLVIGRRGGKSFILATIAVFLAAFYDWRPFLGPGEIATIMIIARDRRQARVIKRFVSGLLHEVPMLRGTIEDEGAETISLKNKINIEIHTASFRSTRGYTIVAALLDEIAFWPSEDAADPDFEVINAIRPGMATIPNAMLLCASSPHARKGALWNAYHRHYGKDGDSVLVWQAATRDMNSVVPQAYIDQHLADDPARASAEYLATFRTDLESYISRDLAEAAVIRGRHEMPYDPAYRYTAFVDPNGGGKDAFALAIAHVVPHPDGGSYLVLDLARERHGKPHDIAKEYAAVVRAYGVSLVRGDNYAYLWPREAFINAGIDYRRADRIKSDLYRDFLPLMSSGRVELLDSDRLLAQLCGLERHVGASGKDQINHPDKGHDDLINAAAGALLYANRDASDYVPIVTPWFTGKNCGPSDGDVAAPVSAHESWARSYYGSGGGSGGINSPDFSMRDKWSDRRGW
jgi:Terminase large subunit, T4likevirus-type, N-terminal